MASFSVRGVLFLAAGVLTLAAAPVRAAETGPVFVVPSRPGVPIAINGRDASWSVVVGDIGLARPGHLTPVIIGGGRPLPPRWSYHHNPYYPRYGVAPARGRNEVDPGPDRPMPEPAESYSRTWSTSSEPHYSERREGEPPRSRQQSYQTESEFLPPTIEDQQQTFPPPIVVVPRRGRRY